MSWIEPMGSKIVVVPDAPPETVRGIHRPDIAAERPQSGVIERMGGIVFLRFPLLGIGVRVAFPPYAGTRVKVDDSERIILVPENLLGVIADAPR